ncbi:site-specific integrase [Streptomyces netropsis]|uniref:Integrase n=1 Tax=Streptomyces netropsis TaxID=55404 RepID=A0A7W7LGZ0_STRNE|nr:site-specific integrase [Streptomyces netropsis]MBB4889859.1 integrase [Streptomyces netropsis]GGR41620.1 integrase [Streptomyces netropsis]
MIGQHAPGLALASISPFAGADVFREAGWTEANGFTGPRFDDDVWDLSGIQGRPQQFRRYELVWDFTEITNPRWRLVAKEFLLACWAPTHPVVAHLARAYRTPRALGTCSRLKFTLFGWLNWLSQHGITSLREVTQEHCDRYLALRSTIRDKRGQRLRDASAGSKQTLVSTIMDLAFYGDLFSSDRYEPDLEPWRFASPSVVAGSPKTAENKTQPVPELILQPLLAACLYIVDSLGPHLTSLLHQVRDRPPRKGGPFRRRPTHTDLSLALDEHRLSREPLVELTDCRLQTRLSAGWSPEDPLIRVSLTALATRAGCREFRSAMLTPALRTHAEETLRAVGLAKPWGQDAPAVPRADTQELVPWTVPLHTREVLELVSMARQATLVITALVSGMRRSELCELLIGCRRTLETAPGMVRHSLASKIIKGKELGGVADEWIVLKEVHQAIALAEDLHDDPRCGESLFGAFAWEYANSLRAWVNGAGGRRLGLAPIPEGKVNLRMLRRTLAMEVAYRPNGMLAAKIALKHVSVVTTEGYAARPGGAQAKLLAEINLHEQDRNTSLALAEFRHYQQGIMPAGPGAQDLIRFFAHVDDQITQHTTASPHVRSGDQDVRNLLAKRADTLHLSSANYCWFADPSKALCLKLAGTPNARKPLAGMCDSARCPQATHHPGHRPVWAEAVSQTTIFLGSLSRPQKGERIRLQAELDRAQRVLDEIDNASGRTPDEESHADH